MGTEKGGKIYDVAQGSFLDASLSHRRFVKSVAFSHDDHLALTGSDDGSAQLWDASTLMRHGNVFAHDSSVNVAAFSPDSRLVLTGSADSTARLWDVGSGRAIGPPLFHRGRVTCAAFSPDGKHFATGSSGHSAFGILMEHSRPMEGDVESIILWSKAFTGMNLDANEVPRPLDVASWQEFGTRLQSLSPSAGKN